MQRGGNHKGDAKYLKEYIKNKRRRVSFLQVVFLGIYKLAKGNEGGLVEDFSEYESMTG